MRARSRRVATVNICTGTARGTARGTVTVLGTPVTVFDYMELTMGNRVPNNKFGGVPVPRYTTGSATAVEDSYHVESELWHSA